MPGEPDVQIALSLGWTMADLYRQGLPGPARPTAPGEHLPGVGALSPAQRALLRLDQIDADLAALSSSIKAHGLPLPNSNELRTAQGDVQTSGAERQAAIHALHVTVLSTLTAVDYRLGKAYGLGRALADTCRRPQDLAELEKRFGHFRLDNVRGWLNDLASVLPDHAARAVLSGLTRWEAWVANLCSLPAAEHEWEPLGKPVQTTLRRQGEMWRAVLSGEKNARDMLSVEGYLKGADSMLQRAFVLAGRFLRKPALGGPLLLLTAAAIGLLLWGVIGEGAAQLTAGIAAAAAAFGITWKTVGDAAQKLGEALEKPLWGAEIDAAVGEALTYLPLVPVREPRADILLDAPRLLRKIDAEQSASGGASGAQSERRAAHMPRTEETYLRNWARAAGYIHSESDEQGVEHERLSHEGQRLAAIPPGENGSVRAALGAGRGIAPSANTLAGDSREDSPSADGLQEDDSDTHPQDRDTSTTSAEDGEERGSA